MRILFLSTPVAPLGSGREGGVGPHIEGLVAALAHKGHMSMVVAPAGSQSSVAKVLEVPGSLQQSCQNVSSTEPWSSPLTNPVLANMLQQAWLIKNDWDVVVSFAYDWLPFFAQNFFEGKLRHFVSMSNVKDWMRNAIEESVKKQPGAVAMSSAAQELTYGLNERVPIIPPPLDVDSMPFSTSIRRNALAWSGRLSVEKGVEDVFRIAEFSGAEIDLFGVLESVNFLIELQHRYPAARVTYQGHLERAQLFERLNEYRAFLATPHWDEAFGMANVEAMACGLPVLGYCRGALPEYVVQGESGILVSPGDWKSLAEVCSNLRSFEPNRCRALAREICNPDIVGEKFLRWINAR